MRRRALPLLLAALALRLPAQDAGAGPEPPADRPRQNVLEDALAKDIEGASYYELVAWCHELGLDDAGSRRALQARLEEHFGLPEPVRRAQAEARVEIVSARETHYFTLEPVGEEYVELRGGVVVKVKDRDRESLHTIEADELVYNQTTGQMTARGNARYVLTKGGKDEVFEGESLSFDTKSLEGVFYEGTVVRERTVGGRSLPFTFHGVVISRLANDTIILEDATMTSSTAADPYYSVGARRAWILADGEWALRGTTLRLGRLPILYLPFLFYPGDEFIFHPALEAREREGTALQTTTYLLGQRKAESDSLSILRLSEEPGTGYQRVRRGMFLTIDPQKREPVQSPDRYVTLMADVYSRLGGMIGVEAKLPPEFSGRVSLGVSRSLFMDEATGSYIPFWNDPEKGYVSVWNYSRIVGLSVPVRYGLDGSLRLRRGLLSASATAELYSDPYYPTDFYSRSDRMKWDSVLGGGSTTTPTPSAKSSLTWSARAEAGLGSLLKIPLVTDLALRPLELSAFIASRTVDTTGDPLAAVDPARSFYYPVSVKAPSVKLSVRGSLLSLPTRRKQTPSTRLPAPAEPTSIRVRENPGKGVKLPGDIQAAREEPATEAGGQTPPARLMPPERDLVLPARKADVNVPIPGTGSSLELTYSLGPGVSLDFPFATQEWLAPADVDYRTSSVSLSTLSDARVTASASLFERVLGISSELQLLGNLRARFRGTAPVDDAQWELQRVPDYLATKLTIGEKTAFTVQPLLGVDSLKGSTLSYVFGWQLLGTTYDPLSGIDPVYVTVAGKLDRDTVSAHSLAASLVFKPDVASQSLSLTAVLPPEEVSVRGQAALDIWKFTTNLGIGVREIEDAWVPDPLTVSEAFKPWSWLTLTQRTQFDLQNRRFATANTDLKLDGLTVKLMAGWMAPVDPLGVPTGGPEAFRASLLEMQYLLPSQSALLWKNRIELEAGMNTRWNWYLQKYMQNELTFSMNVSFSIYRFLTLKFTADSYNNRMYRYFRSYAEAVGDEWVNPLYDLIRSFNFFNVNDRYLSAFKIRRLSIAALHQMEDWDLRIEYQGKPELVTHTDGTLQYEWARSLLVQVEWKPLPVIRTRVRADSSGLQIR